MKILWDLFLGQVISDFPISLKLLWGSYYGKKFSVPQAGADLGFFSVGGGGGVVLIFEKFFENFVDK